MQAQLDKPALLIIKTEVQFFLSFRNSRVFVILVSAKLLSGFGSLAKATGGLFREIAGHREGNSQTSCFR